MSLALTDNVQVNLDIEALNVLFKCLASEWICQIIYTKTKGYDIGLVI